VADLFEWDETGAFDEEVEYVGIIGREEEGGVQLEALPKLYWQYKDLVEEKKAEMLEPRRMFDHAINLKEEAEPRWGPIYLISARQLNKLDKYIKQVLAQGQIVDSESRYGAPILNIQKPDGSLRQCVDHQNLTKLTMLNKYQLPVTDEV